MNNALRSRRDESRSVRGVGWVVVAMVAVAGCSTGESDQAATWVEPGWMAQARQEVEEYTASKLACLAEFGAEGVVGLAGTVGTGGELDENGNLPPGIDELNRRAAAECNARVPSPTLWGGAPDRAAYERNLDVRECLLSHGYESPEPPSFEVWAEAYTSFSGELWYPYMSITAPGSTVSDEELAQLMVACPQTAFGLSEVIPDVTGSG